MSFSPKSVSGVVAIIDFLLAIIENGLAIIDQILTNRGKPRRIYVCYQSRRFLSRVHGGFYVVFAIIVGLGG